MTDDKKPDSPVDDPLASPAHSEPSATAPRRVGIKIGSQRDTAATPKAPQASELPERAVESGEAGVDEAASGVEPQPDGVEAHGVEAHGAAGALPSDGVSQDALTNTDSSSNVTSPEAEALFPAPRVKQISTDLQAEIDAALEGVSIDELMTGEERAVVNVGQPLELDQRCAVRVIKCDREFVFFSLDGQHEGIASRRQFTEVPEVGATMDVVPSRFLVEDNLYEVLVPGASVDVQDWSDLSEGVVVEARITGHNKGGLDCEVHHIRGFIPISQISLYRVDDLEPYEGQTLQCLVTEANPDRRNLVLSHRAILERQQEEAREKLLEELEVGQIREGIVRRLQPFGAFVDLGGIDGLIHVSQLSWDRVAHPNEVLEEGQKVSVRIDKIDIPAGRIGLSYRDLLEDPWQDAENKYPVGTVLEGTVTKIMEFGAFVKIASGVEGLVHISEIAHHRVSRVGAFVKEGQPVQVEVLSIDPESQRISLSMKAAQAMPAADVSDGADDAADEPLERTVPEHQGPLQGGLGRKTGGEQFGLKW